MDSSDDSDDLDHYFKEDKANEEPPVDIPDEDTKDPINNFTFQNPNQDDDDADEGEDEEVILQDQKDDEELPKQEETIIEDQSFYPVEAEP